MSISPTALFDLYFDDTVIDFMVEMTNLYAQHDKSKHDFLTSPDEMRLFIAMLLLSGYNVLPRRKLYRENSTDVHCEAMSSTMSRNRFEQLMFVFHLSDNMKLDKSDKMAKIRPF